MEPVACATIDAERILSGRPQDVGNRLMWAGAAISGSVS